tara:strand:+ start:2062 stop:2316 length:255 start_codon:yes stop_codon:yes gene_type:complete
MANSPKKKVVVEPVITPKKLAERVEFLVEKDQMTHTEAIIEVCEELELEPEDMAKLVKKGPLKEKLQAEALNRNIIKRTTAKLF